jgi:LETM1-like protein
LAFINSVANPDPDLFGRIRIRTSGIGSFLEHIFVKKFSSRKLAENLFRSGSGRFQKADPDLVKNRPDIDQNSVCVRSVAELQTACKDRGMRAVGLTQDKLRQQLKQWIELSTNEKVRAHPEFSHIFCRLCRGAGGAATFCWSRSPSFFGMAPAPGM